MPFVDNDSAAARAEKRSVRQSRLIKAVLECERFGHFDVTIRNVSQTGIGGTGPHCLDLGELLTVILPGHGPMKAIVRWVAGQRFGIETESDIQIDQLRSAQAGSVPASNKDIEFRIIPPPKIQGRRPGLVLGAATPPGTGKSRW